MSISTILLYLLASITLFFLLNYIDKKYSDNYLNRVIITVIYIIVLAGIFTNYNLVNNNDNIFLIVIIELLIRIFIYGYIKEINIFKNNPSNQKKYIYSIVATYIINYYFINKIDNVLPDIQEVKIIIWFLIIIYIYIILKNNINKDSFKHQKVYFYKDREYVVMQYAKLKNKYSHIVKTRYRQLEPLIYAIMIYENYNHPEISRNLDKLKYKLDKNSNKYGIMQIYSNYPISDEESIKISIKKLERIYSNIYNKNNFNNKTTYIINKYYKSNNNTKKIMNIYNIIITFNRI